MNFRKRDLGRLSRGLRFRLTIASAGFFAIILICIAVLFRENLASNLTTQEHTTLEERWNVLKSGYLDIDKEKSLDPNEPEKAFWVYDDEDPDDKRIAFDFQQMYMIADANGKVVQLKDNAPAISDGFKELGALNPAQIRARVDALKRNPRQIPFWDVKRVGRDTYLIRSGLWLSTRLHNPYYVSIGMNTTQDRETLRNYTFIYIAVLPLALVLASLLGWAMAGRALTPVREVAQAAQRISGSNLSLRIPTRQAGDELDYLILTFNRMIERLESSFQQMKQFSTDVSHELRTPITAIRGQLEVALFTAKTTDQYREAMFNALQDIDRLSQIVRALLLLSQAESGQLALQKARLNLCELAEDLVEQFQIPAEAAGVHLTSAVSKPSIIGGDRVQIERMITNLLSNAIKFTPAGGDVRVSVHPHEEYVEMIVEDTGRGIPTEHLPHIFDRFYRVPNSGSAPSPEQGLGLGLSFVAWIVKAHNGKIDVDSTPGKGSRFTIKLPSAGVGADTMELAVEHAADQPGVTNPMRI